MTTSPLQGSSEADVASLSGIVAPPEGWPNPRRGFLFFLGLASIGAGMGSLTPAVLTLTLKAQLIDPKHATTILSIVVGVAGIAGLIAFPALGRLSDRSLSRFGRRRPFLVLGAVLFAVGSVGMLLAPNTAVLTIVDVFIAVGYSATMVAVTATIPDQLEPGRRGPASVLVGLSLPLGAVTGLFIAQLVSPNLALMILLPAAIAVIGAVAFAIRLGDRRLRAEDRPHFTWVEFARTYWVNPVTHANFGWAWWSRLLIFLGVSAIQAYQAFFLIIELHFTPASVGSAVFLSTLVLTAFALVFSAIAGRLSDRIGRRKPFVVAAAAIFAVGLAVAATAHSFPAFLVAIGIVGLGQGVYMAVDIALVTQILPDPNNPAKDLGIMNLASTVPTAIVPAVAPVILAIGASATMPQNFAALFLFGAIAGIVGALLVLPIRGVR